MKKLLLIITFLVITIVAKAQVMYFIPSGHSPEENNISVDIVVKDNSGQLWKTMVYIVTLKSKSLDFRNGSLSNVLKITFETEDEKKIEDIKKTNLKNALEGLSSDEAKEIYLKNEKDVELKFKKKDNRALIYSFLLAGAMLIINTLTGYLQ